MQAFHLAYSTLYDNPQAGENVAPPVGEIGGGPIKRHSVLSLNISWATHYIEALSDIIPGYGSEAVTNTVNGVSIFMCGTLAHSTLLLTRKQFQRGPLSALQSATLAYLLHTIASGTMGHKKRAFGGTGVVVPSICAVPATDATRGNPGDFLPWEGPVPPLLCTPARWFHSP